MDLAGGNLQVLGSAHRVQEDVELTAFLLGWKLAQGKRLAQTGT
jgi:hypothetical protein